MEHESETFGDLIYNYISVNGREVNIEKAKVFLKNYISEETLEQIHFIPDLIYQFKAKNLIKNLSRCEFIVLLKCLFSLLKNDELGYFVDDYEHLTTTIDIRDDENMYHLYYKISIFIDDSIGSTDVTTLKEDFRHVVESERTLSDIRTLSQLLGIIEDRDAISDNDLSALEYILDKLDKNERVTMAKRLISLCSRLLVMQNSCKTCGCQTEFNPFSVSNISNTGIDLNDKGAKDSEDYPSNGKSELKFLMNYLSKNLGPDWKKLARTLDIKESKIKCFIDENPKDVEEQSMQMLLFWRNSNEDASKQKLLTALRDPICQKILLAREIEQDKHLMFY